MTRYRTSKPLKPRQASSWQKPNIRAGTLGKVCVTMICAGLLSSANRPESFAATKDSKTSLAATPKGTSPKKAGASIGILDKQKQLERFTWWDNKDWNWYKENIPFWESPDAEIDATYYYRWELLTKHMVYGSPESGYSFTEFINRPPWSGRYGAISCGLGLQFSELRWLKDERPLRDYVRYWYGTPGAQPLSYSNWYGDAAWGIYLVNNDKPWITNLLPSMEEQYQGWTREHWRPNHKMFAWSGMHDGMETNIASRQTKDWFAGAESYRPTLNAYIYGDLVAMANTAELRGDKAKTALYRQKAAELKQRLQQELWDPRRQFFLSQFANDEEKDGITIKANTRMYEDGKYKGDAHGRELIGYVPWMFNLPDKGKGYEVAWKGVTDPQVFLAPYGLYTVERHDPQFTVVAGTCIWSGNNWPYANAQTLQALANVINNYPQNVVTKDDYMKVFNAYTRNQRENGRPYLAETSDPDTGKWTFDEPNKSEHYFHSSYNDLLITGLAGLRPRADSIVEVNPLVPANWNYFALDDVKYHGHQVSIVWDKLGTRYKRGKGLAIWVDGRKVASRPQLGLLQGKLPEARSLSGTDAGEKAPTLYNLAVNNDGNYYPHVRTSSTGDGTSPANIVDGVFYYHSGRPVNRWIGTGDARQREWVEIDFGTARSIQVAKLYVLDDGPGQKVRAPQKIDLEFWKDGHWQTIPKQVPQFTRPIGHAPNTITFPAVSTSRVRALLTPETGSTLGLCELELWGHAQLPLPVVPVKNNLALGAKASASYTSRFDDVSRVNDGKIVPGTSGEANRWTAYESPNSSDWVQLDFPQATTVSRIGVVFWGDNGGVRLPKSYSLEYWTGTAWHPVEELNREPTKPTLGLPNEVTIKPVQTDRLRVTVAHDSPGRSGITELLVWGPE